MQSRMILPLVVCALLSTITVPSCNGEDLDLYKVCLMECYRCVKTYGKEVYNGKVCALNCLKTKGQSIDSKCYPPTKRGDFKAVLTMECRNLCQRKCAPDFHHDSMDAHACMFTCIISQETIVAC
ncbi:hypothetical protein PoB_006122100 [Plakobranchus ocellatus]|uniref:Uncharacterized protein n=1 Tax=Plakobranchus ocellatus TaxID=259542 RepID=A0AAV4CS78_9GAST|nr:hypothetical protein PoB_006122100 [Plakobranchus ocellatus]